MSITNYSFFNSIDLFVNNKQIIVYPDVDSAKSFKGYSITKLQKHFQNIIETDSEFFKDMDYGISFIWSFEGEKMLDFWKFNANFVDDRSGPLADVRIYKNKDPVSNLGTASGNTLLVLGIEEELRRKSQDLDSYLAGPAPLLPDGMQVNEDFFQYT